MKSFPQSGDDPMRQLLPLLALPTLCALGSCDPGGNTDPQPFRVAVATFSHETCTFCPGGDVTVADWERVGPPVGGEALLGEGGYIGGFVSMAEDYGDMELIGLSSPPWCIRRFLQELEHGRNVQSLPGTDDPGS